MTNLEKEIALIGASLVFGIVAGFVSWLLDFKKKGGHACIGLTAFLAALIFTGYLNTNWLEVQDVWKRIAPILAISLPILIIISLGLLIPKAHSTYKNIKETSQRPK